MTYMQLILAVLPIKLQLELLPYMSRWRKPVFCVRAVRLALARFSTARSV